MNSFKIVNCHFGTNSGEVVTYDQLSLYQENLNSITGP